MSPRLLITLGVTLLAVGFIVQYCANHPNPLVLRYAFMALALLLVLVVVHQFRVGATPNRGWMIFCGFGWCVFSGLVCSVYFAVEDETYKTRAIEANTKREQERLAYEEAFAAHREEFKRQQEQFDAEAKAREAQAAQQPPPESQPQSVATAVNDAPPPGRCVDMVPATLSNGSLSAEPYVDSVCTSKDGVVTRTRKPLPPPTTVSPTSNDSHLSSGEGGSERAGPLVRGRF